MQWFVDFANWMGKSKLNAFLQLDWSFGTRKNCMADFFCNFRNEEQAAQCCFSDVIKCSRRSPLFSFAVNSVIDWVNHSIKSIWTLVDCIGTNSLFSSGKCYPFSWWVRKNQSHFGCLEVFFAHVKISKMFVNSEQNDKYWIYYRIIEERFKKMHLISGCQFGIFLLHGTSPIRLWKLEFTFIVKHFCHVKIFLNEKCN